MTTFAQAYKGFNQAVFSALNAEKQIVTEIANVLDKILPALAPSEFENSVENLLLQTKKMLLSEGNDILLKTGDILADIIMSKLVKNLPAAKPAKNKVDAKIPAYEFMIASLVQDNKNNSSTEGRNFHENKALPQMVSEVFDDLLSFNSMYHYAIDDSLLNSSINRDDHQNKISESLAVIAGALLAPGFLTATYGTQAQFFEKPKFRKRNF
jgi:hypothetical protein